MQKMQFMVISKLPWAAFISYQILTLLSLRSSSMVDVVDGT